MDFQIWTFYLSQILIYCALALSLNLLLGYAGQVSVAHAAFGAIGGYTVGYMKTIHGWGFVPSALFGLARRSGGGVRGSLPAGRRAGGREQAAHGSISGGDNGKKLTRKKKNNRRR